MSSHSSVITFDLSCRETDQRILPCSPIFSSHTFNWEGVYVQHHRQPSWETPECDHFQHTIVIHPVTSQARVERRLDGHRRKEKIIRGDSVLAPAGVYHQVSWDQDIEYTLLVLEPAYIAHIAHEEVAPESVEIVPQFAQSDPLIYQIGLTLKRELELAEQSSRLYVEAGATMLAVHLLRHYSIRQPSLQPNVGRLSQIKLNQAIEYIDTFLSEDLSVAAIAASLGMSQYHFTRLFKQSTGLTPYQYVTRQRVALAKQLLDLSSLSITQVSQQLGFSNSNQFSYFFRKHTGISPREYRQKS